MKKLAAIRKKAEGEEVNFIKQFPVNPRDTLKRKGKGELVNYNKLNKKNKNDDVVFIKQVPIHPRDRLKKSAVIDEKVKFIKQVPVHPRDRLRRKIEKEVDFTADSIKQVPVHPRDRLKRVDRKLGHPKNRMKNQEGQLSRGNVSKLMRAEFDFNPKKILNKTLIFDSTKINEEK